MGRTIRSYSKVDQANEMIKKLCEKYPEVFWSIQPEKITVMGIDNVERSDRAIERSKIWSALRNVKGVEKAIFMENNIGIRYILEVFWADWNKWSDSLRLAVLTENLLEITPEVEKKNRPDCNGFRLLFDALGLQWKYDESDTTGSKIPNLLMTDVKFDLELRPGLEPEEEEIEGPEFMKN